MLVIKDKDGSLKNIHHHLIVLGQEVCLQLKVSMIKQPKNFPILELFNIELGELILSSHHLVWKSTLRNLLERPMATGKNLSTELNILYKSTKVSWPLREFLFVVLHDLLGLEHILKHGLDFVDGVVTALNLQFVDH
jgi:hypothetical protein